MGITGLLNGLLHPRPYLVLYVAIGLPTDPLTDFATARELGLMTAPNILGKQCRIERMFNTAKNTAKNIATKQNQEYQTTVLFYAINQIEAMEEDSRKNDQEGHVTFTKGAHK